MAQPEVVNPVPFEDVEEWQRAFAMTLLLELHTEEFERGVTRRRRGWVPERSWGVRDRGHWVATLATIERTITVPGGGIGTHDLLADALTAVTVAGTHHRRGLLTTMLTQSLAAAKDRGDALSILIAAEWPIYGRFGYAPATAGARYRLDPRRARGVAGSDPTSVRPMRLDEVAGPAPAVFDAARRLRPGQVDRPGNWWERATGWDDQPPVPWLRASWFAHEGPDGPDGLLAWKTTHEFDLTSAGRIEVIDMFAATDEAYRDLWGYLAGLDVIGAVDLNARAVDEPVRWLLGDGRALATADKFDYVWLRLLDVPAALAARGYAVPGQLVLEVVDEQGAGYAAGRYELTADDTGAACARTDAPADLRLDQRDLAAAYLGGHRLRQVGVLGRVDELTPGALARADLMFSTPLPPWNQTGF